jgi:transcriptional regulator with GAF, ATPase, and Fis domain
MTSEKKLDSLRQRLSHLRVRATVSEFTSLVTFYIEVLPKLMQVERCTIFLKESDGDSLLSRYGTGLETNVIEAPLEGSIVGRVMATGESVIENDLHSKSGYHLEADEQTGFVSVNTLCIPIPRAADDEILGVIQLLNTLDGEPFDSANQKELQKIAEYLSISLESILLNEQILNVAQGFNGEVSRMEFDSVREGLFIAESPAMRELLDLVMVLHDTPVNVLIQGENGTGKELVAKMIHDNAGKTGRPFVPVNCACLPEALVESEFFGHEKGAFTGADKSRKGRFEEASGGTLFLDEIGEMPLMVQPKFLRAIQEQEGTRLGSSEIVQYNVRIISATNRDLSKEVEQGDFREDLFFRLFSVEIEIPPLRERKEDILLLALSFLKETNEKFKKNVSGFSPKLLALFDEYPWPGNVRQLLKEVERLVALTKDDRLMEMETCSRELRAFADANYVPEKAATDDDLSIPGKVTALEKYLIHKAMKKADGNKTQAAKYLNITRQGLLKKIKRYQLDC